MKVKKRSKGIKKIGGVVLDTNIIIRALTDDDPELSRIISMEEEIHIPLPIFFEVVFVLEKIYKQPREMIIDYISTITSYDNIFTDKNTLKEMLYIYGNENTLSIIDCFLFTYAKTNNVKLTTLDKDLKRYVGKNSK